MCGACGAIRKTETKTHLINQGILNNPHSSFGFSAPPHNAIAIATKSTLRPVKRFLNPLSSSLCRSLSREAAASRSAVSAACASALSRAHSASASAAFGAGAAAVDDVGVVGCCCSPALQ